MCSTTSSVTVLGSMPNVEWLPDAVLIVRGRDHRIVQANLGAVRMFGYGDRSSLINQSVSTLVPLDVASHAVLIDRVFDDMQPRLMGGYRQVRGRRCDGSEFDVSIELAPAIIQVGGCDHFEKVVTCVCRNVTEHNKTVAARYEAEQRHRLTEQFLRIINHEVRTSIHAITNSLSTLKTDLHSLLIDQANYELTPDFLAALTNDSNFSINDRQLQALSLPMFLKKHATCNQTHQQKRLETINLPMRRDLSVVQAEGGSLSPGPILQSLQVLDKGVTSMDTLLINMLDFQNLKEGNFAAHSTLINCKSMFSGMQRRFDANCRKRIVVEIQPSRLLFFAECTLVVRLLNVLLENAIRHTDEEVTVRLACHVLESTEQTKGESSSQSINEYAAHTASFSNDTTDKDQSENRSNASTTSYDDLMQVNSSRLNSPYHSRGVVLWLSHSASMSPTRSSTATPTTASSMSIPDVKPQQLLVRSKSASSKTSVDFDVSATVCDVETSQELCTQMSEQDIFNGAPTRQIQFVVSDTGPGVPTAVLNGLQNLTLALDASAIRSSSSGLGLGFRIAKLCAQQLEGTLEWTADDPLNNTCGTTFNTHFTFTMLAPCIGYTPGSHEQNTVSSTMCPSTSHPAAQTHPLLSISSSEEKHAMVQRVLSSEFEGARRAMRILIVEDNMVNVKVIKQCLTKRCFTCLTVAMNGQEAVERAAENVFDLILMDLEMPVKDGAQAAREIIAGTSAVISKDIIGNYVPEVSRCYNQTPIIALTANATKDAQDRCLSAGMSLFLTKPLNVNDLMLVIAALSPFNFYPLVWCPHLLA